MIARMLNGITPGFNLLKAIELNVSQERFISFNINTL